MVTVEDTQQKKVSDTIVVNLPYIILQVLRLKL